MEEKYCIYCYTNQINGKKYIGQSKDIQRRCHPSNYKGCIKFYNAINKYGWHNFIQTILESNLTLEEANIKEEKYILELDTINNGYNLKSGGFNNIYSKESKEKMSAQCKTKQKIICIETQQIYDSAKEIERIFGYANSNIIACCKGKLLSAYGYTWEYYENFQNNISTKTKDKRIRSVYCVELDKTFKSASEAARELGIQRSNISKCCAGQIKTSGGYHWRYGY